MSCFGYGPGNCTRSRRFVEYRPRYISGWARPKKAQLVSRPRITCLCGFLRATPALAPHRLVARMTQRLQEGKVSCPNPVRQPETAEFWLVSRHGSQGPMFPDGSPQARRPRKAGGDTMMGDSGSDPNQCSQPLHRCRQPGGALPSQLRHYAEPIRDRARRGPGIARAQRLLSAH
jgi:hypothetical protein